MAGNAGLCMIAGIDEMPFSIVWVLYIVYFEDTAKKTLGLKPCKSTNMSVWEMQLS